MVHRCENILDELNKLYPTGLVLGDAYAIVGDLGLTIQWNNFKTENGHLVIHTNQERLEPNTKIPITEIKDGAFIFRKWVPNAVIHHSHFKGFSRTIKT